MGTGGSRAGDFLGGHARDRRRNRYFCEDSGALAAADAVTGKPLWRFQANQVWKASPMTYVFDNKQYVAVASGSSVISFGLVE